MGFVAVARGLWLFVLCNCLNVTGAEGKQGIFQSVGSQRIARFPVYKEVAGFNIYLRFSTTTCRGHLAEITTMDSNYYLRLTLLDTGPIRLSFNTLHGKGQLDLSMPSAGNFCDGKTHVMILKLFSGAVSYGVDGSPVVRFFVSRLSVLFPSPANITIGRKFEGCVSDSTVVNRFNETQEYVVGISRDCHSHRSSAPSVIPSSTTTDRKCQPLISATCRSLGYNFTQFPNHLRHKTQLVASASLSKLISKLRAECSANLIPFLCQLYFPPCVLPKSSSISPCGSLCETVQKDCAKIGRLGFRWPGYLACDQFPRVTNAVKCFMRSTKPTNKTIALRELRSKTRASSLLVTTMPTAKEEKPDIKHDTTYPAMAQRLIRMTRKIIDTSIEVSSEKMNVSTPQVKKGANKPIEINVATSTRNPTSKVYASNRAITSVGRQMLYTSVPSLRTIVVEQLISVKSGKLSGLKRTKTAQATTTGKQPLTADSARETKRSTSPTSPTRQTKTPLYNISTSHIVWNKEGKCGGLLLTPEGQMTSPGFPNAYPVNSRCKWVITLPVNYQLISLTFEELYLEEDRNCVYDYVAVFDKLDNQVGRRQCGSNTNRVFLEVKGNMAVVVFRSDSANSKKGFVLSYKGHICPLLSQTSNLEPA